MTETKKNNRRSKKSSANAPSDKSGSGQSKTSSTTTAEVKDDGKEISLEEQLDRALVAVTSSQQQTLKIHNAWRSQLQRVSILVLVVIMTQVKAPGSACMESIKTWNESMELHNNTEDVIMSRRGIMFMARDSIMEGMSFFCGLCIVVWVSTVPPKSEFSSLFFRVASSLVPLIAFFYSQDRKMGCLRHLENPYSSDEIEPELQSRPFPVVLIFYMVTALSIFAMNVQRTGGEQNIDKVQKLKEELLQSKKKK